MDSWIHGFHTCESCLFQYIKHLKWLVCRRVNLHMMNTKYGYRSNDSSLSECHQQNLFFLTPLSPVLHLSSPTPRTLPGHSQDTPRTLTGHSQDTPRTLTGHSQDTHRTLTGHSQDTHRTLTERVRPTWSCCMCSSAFLRMSCTASAANFLPYLGRESALRGLCDWSTWSSLV